MAGEWPSWLRSNIKYQIVTIKEDCGGNLEVCTISILVSTREDNIGRLLYRLSATLAIRNGENFLLSLMIMA